MASGPIARVGRHPIHPMLVVFPLGLWIFGLVTYIIFLSTGQDVWDYVAWYSIAGGIIGAVLAAAAGFADFLAIPPSRARTIAIWHMLVNVAALALFILALWTRWYGYLNAPLICAIAGTVGILVSGWLGGSLVYLHGVAISEEGVQDHLARTSMRGHREEPGMGPSGAQPLPG